MSDIKYTNDGKKVLVVGKLNAEQTIVQEIFVSAGQEIPSGEKFVVKSLHDQPSESWKEKNLRELEQRYEKERATLERQIEEQNRRLGLERDKAKAQTSALLSFLKSSDESQLETLKNFMAGQITHLFVSGYSPEIVSWKDGHEVYDIDSYNGRMRLDGIKLVSLMGNSDGDLSYRLHSYRDGSGGSRTIYPANGYQEALAMAQAELDEQARKFVAGESSSFYLADWERIEGAVIPAVAREKCEAIADAQRIKRIEELRAQLEKLEASA